MARPCHFNVYGSTFIIWLVIVLEWSRVDWHWPICDILVFSKTLNFFTSILIKWQFSIKTPFQASFIEWRLVFSFSNKVKILIKAAKQSPADMITEFWSYRVWYRIQSICIGIILYLLYIYDILFLYVLDIFGFINNMENILVHIVKLSVRTIFGVIISIISIVIILLY